MNDSCHMSGMPGSHSDSRTDCINFDIDALLLNYQHASIVDHSHYNYIYIYVKIKLESKVSIY